MLKAFDEAVEVARKFIADGYSVNLFDTGSGYEVASRKTFLAEDGFAGSDDKESA